MQSVFYEHTSLEALIREMPQNVQIEAGLDAVDAAGSGGQRAGREGRREEALGRLTNAITRLVGSKVPHNPL